MSETPIIELIRYIAAKLVDQPDEVDVQEFDEEGEIVIELHVAEDDLGKVIGKQGRTARAMRQLLQAAATKRKKRYALEIVE
jgi:predicted RNA-binding protein YlqC (UPF0109 family)